MNSCEGLSLWSMVVNVPNERTDRLKQEDHCRHEATLGYLATNTKCELHKKFCFKERNKQNT